MNARCVGFVGSAHPVLGQAIFKLSEVPQGRLQLDRFADGEIRCVIESEVRGKTVFVFQSSVTPVHESLMELMVMCDAIARLQPKRLIIVMPFVPYRRQEKQSRPGESLTLRLVGELLQTSGVQECMTVNLHRPQSITLLARQVLHISVMDDLIRGVAKLHQIDVVCAPDNGAIPLAQTAAQELGAEIISVEKKRVGPDKIHCTPFVPSIAERLVGKRVLIIDDEVDTGATVAAVARMVKRAGAKSITLAAVHPVLAGPAHRMLSTIPYDYFLVSNSLPMTTAQKLPRIKIIPIQSAVAAALRQRMQFV